MPPKKAQYTDIIDTLRKGNFHFECPNTGEDIPLRTAIIFDNDNFSPEALSIYKAQLLAIRERKETLKNIKLAGNIRSQTGAQSVNIGFLLERLAPTLPGFRFSHHDCRSLFDPIDYIIFEGLSKKNSVDRIFFVDIKTGNARLNNRQKEIKSIVSSKNVTFKRY